MSTSPRWLTPEQTSTWLGLWSVTELLPKRLDEQLKRDEGVNLYDYFTLAQLSMAANEELTMSELAAVADMTPSRLSHVLNRLESRGWAVRRTSSTDRRTNIACLTDAGRAFISSAAPGHVEQVLSLVFDQLDEAETRALGRILAKILSRLDQPQMPRA
ncbi:MarR family winged helix-turn-helix transcriptional regulator [Corynebacterium uterequi]|uniref:Transcriptional regulator n=1 Tax=Corynebacterium uterequi TaxID=1072256 RepID=A0A0G3HDY2_9CORY|nr:MarR family transcriptional regulator [Corynebacterium uterequi]AKK10935.1 transcriptional regulator [Corynebacterium uterequi]